MERLTTRMQHRPAMYTLIIYNYDKDSWYLNHQQLVYIALTTLQIRRLLWDDVDRENVCILRCSIYTHVLQVNEVCV